METVHRILAYVVIVAIGAGIVWSLAAARRPAWGGRPFARYQAIAVIVVVVASVAGLFQLVSGGHPKETLHLLYAAIAVAVLPLTRSFVPGTDRRAGIATLAAFVVLGFVVYRLFATG